MLPQCKKHFHVCNYSQFFDSLFSRSYTYWLSATSSRPTLLSHIYFDTHYKSSEFVDMTTMTLIIVFYLPRQYLSAVCRSNLCQHDRIKRVINLTFQTNHLPANASFEGEKSELCLRSRGVQLVSRQHQIAHPHPEKLAVCMDYSHLFNDSCRRKSPHKPLQHGIIICVVLPTIGNEDHLH